jgi:hypothetical protein
VFFECCPSFASYRYVSLLQNLLKAQPDIARQTSDPSPNIQRANLTLASFDMSGIPPEKPSLEA